MPWICQRSARSSRPSTSTTWRSSIPSHSIRSVAQVGVHAGAHLEPHDLAEAAAAQLVLDGAQQVVGLVGDREVGVARDPEVVVAEDLHAGEQLVEVAGDHAPRAA